MKLDSDRPDYDFSTKPDQRIDEVRHDSIRTATRILITGTPDRVSVASSALFTSVLYQAQLAGVRV